MIHASITGHLGRNAEIKTTQQGREFLTMSVATNYRRKEQGEWVKKTQWIDIVSFNTGQAQYLTKGTKVLAYGEIQLGTYADREGKTRIQANLKADRLELLSWETQSNNTTNQQTQTDDGDIPF